MLPYHNSWHTSSGDNGSVPLKFNLRLANADIIVAFYAFHMRHYNAVRGASSCASPPSLLKSTAITFSSPATELLSICSHDLKLLSNQQQTSASQESKKVGQRCVLCKSISSALVVVVQVLQLIRKLRAAKSTRYSGHVPTGVGQPSHGQGLPRGQRPGL